MKKPTRAIVTGASSGIGMELARLLAAQGCDLVIAARRAEQLEALRQELRSRFKIEVEVMSVDLTDPGAPARLLDFATAGGKEIDLLVNNAGAGPYRKFLSSPLSEHQRVLQLNLVSLTELTHRCAQHMLAHGRPASILNVASVASYQLVPRFAVYCASKSYVRIFSEILAAELKGSSVSVSCLCPGGTATEFLSSNNQALNSGGERFLMPASKVARIGLEGALRGQRVIIPGLFNKLTCWSTKLLPNAFNLWAAEKAMGLAVRAAKE